MQPVQGLIFGVLEWLFWVVAIISAAAALFRAESITTGNAPGVRRKSGLLTGLWVLATAAALAGFITAMIAMRVGVT
ncbi:hypothetical protein KIH31_02465 [Paenarthrobacter sp. DKR-5]|uniref:hypothetical protein n=1 Tax=Paenarthrobacter sp. DKR-5 TaxID=2835535 RepID=UPI001BDDAC88|nr:hypothetical protein [Paenarthrobacter sp. DKR-5]MBT1001454.1 hypothetical protein [Paenarthrobacter sp. DKR-5]